MSKGTFAKAPATHDSAVHAIVQLVGLAVVLVLLSGDASAQRKTNMVRPQDGAVIGVPDEHVADYELLGYLPESAEDAVARYGEEARRKHYTTTKQKLIAFAEGVAVGASAGLLTLFLNDADTSHRAKYARSSKKSGLALGITMLAALVVWSLYRRLRGRADNVARATICEGCGELFGESSTRVFIHGQRRAVCAECVAALNAAGASDTRSDKHVPTSEVPLSPPQASMSSVSPPSLTPAALPPPPPPPAQAEAGAAAPRQNARPQRITRRPVPACPTCRGPTSHVPEYDRFLCERCNQYL